VSFLLLIDFSFIEYYHRFAFPALKLRRRAKLGTILVTQIAQPLKGWGAEIQDFQNLSMGI